VASSGSSTAIILLLSEGFGKLPKDSSGTLLARSAASVPSRTILHRMPGFLGRSRLPATHPERKRPRAPLWLMVKGLADPKIETRP
jgi:hypothetical protein